MPDNHGGGSSQNDSYQQRLAQKNADLAQLRRKETVAYESWQRSTVLFPALKGVTSREAFTEVSERHPEIPKEAFDDLEQANQYAEEIRIKEAEALAEDKKEKEKNHKKDSHQLHGVNNEPKYMDHDQRYRDLLEADPLVKQFRATATDPNIKNLSSIALLEDDVYGLNPALIPHLKALDPTFDPFLFEERARAAFEKDFSSDAKVYKARENVRIYKNPKLDPELERLERRITQKIGITLQTQSPGTSHAERVASTRQEELLNFARRFLHKAQAYAKYMPELAGAIGVALEEQARGITLAGSALFAAEDGISPSGLYADTLARYDTSYDTGESETTPAEPDGPGEIPNLHSPEYHKQLENKAFTSPPPSQDSGSGSGGGAGNGGRSTRSSPRQPSRTPPRRSRPPTPATHQAIKWARRIPPWIFTPQGLITLGIIIAIIIFFFIIGGFGSMDQNPDGTYNVNITKTGPTAVPNPKEADLKKPDVSDITYEINVTYNGAADSIVVTDPLDKNADFVSASGPGNPSYDAATHTVTWNILPGSAAQPSTSPSALLPFNFLLPPASLPIVQRVHAQSGEGTIHDLGFGPSNAARVEAMIKKLRPDSPLAGHGGEIISYAKEFNLDPLMIIITMKESQLCADNGVNSPAGSDPDNFNCGNITWEAAQDGAEVSRWKTTSGPSLTFDNFTYVYAYVPTVQDGIGLFFDYLDNPLYEGKTIIEFYETYNSCDNPGNRSEGFVCGAAGAEEMLQLLRDNAGEPCSGTDCTIGSSPKDNGFGTIAPLGLIVRPKTSDSWVINQAFVEVIGAKSPDSPSHGPGTTAPDGKHACPVNATFQPFTGYETIGKNNMSWICEHCHDSNTWRSIDMGTFPGGGTPVTALADGTATKFDDGRSIALEGDDGVLYFYTHMAERSIPDGSTRVTMGQVLGTVAAAGAPGSANNNVAHLHIQGTTNNDHYHPNIYMGPLLDSWCSVDVCKGKPQNSCGFE